MATMYLRQVQEQIIKSKLEETEGINGNTAESW